MGPNPPSSSCSLRMGRRPSVALALAAAAATFLASGRGDHLPVVSVAAFTPSSSSSSASSITSKLHRILRQRATASMPPPSIAALYPGLGGGGGAVSPSSSSSRGLSSAATSRAVTVNDASSSSSSSSVPSSSSSAASTLQEAKREERRKLIRSEGGRFAFDTKYGALNPYGIYYGLTSILLGLPWFVALTACQLFYAVTRNKIDPQRRIVNLITQVWGVSLMRLTGARPALVNQQVLLDFYKQNRPAMFVANHNSWMDIPFLGGTIGWRNYKLVSKKELGRVPILGKAIKVGGHIMVDRSDRKSQLQTLKRGIQYLKDGVHLCTYPEGTRSRSGRLGKFKNGAFKMAHKAGAPVIPISIQSAAKVMPPHWMFPYRPASKVAKVVIHPPIESAGKTEEELAAAVRASLISGLPEDQRPLHE